MSALRGCQEHRFERSNRDHPTRRLDSGTRREKRVFTASNSGHADTSASGRSLQRKGVTRGISGGAMRGCHERAHVRLNELEGGAT